MDTGLIIAMGRYLILAKPTAKTVRQRCSGPKQLLHRHIIEEVATACKEVIVDMNKKQKGK